MTPLYNIYPCGDSALTLELGNRISTELNLKIMALYHRLRQHPFSGMLDAVVAYSSLTVRYDAYTIYTKEQPETNCYQWVSQKILEAFQQSDRFDQSDRQHHRIPVCYDPQWGMDLVRLSNEKHCSPEQIIQWHCASEYRIFMMGFLPGFPYMGELPESLTTRRKDQPAPVPRGSVAIAGRQTGIYPFDSPGGWNIIGRTPLKLFDAHAAIPVPFRPGDAVTFYPVSRSVYDEIYQLNHHVGTGA